MLIACKKKKNKKLKSLLVHARHLWILFHFLVAICIFQGKGGRGGGWGRAFRCVAGAFTEPR